MMGLTKVSVAPAPATATRDSVSPIFVSRRMAEIRK